MERDVEEVRRGQKQRGENSTIEKKRKIQERIRGRKAEVVEEERDGS